MIPEIKSLKKRLKSWKDEKMTDKYKMGHLADKVIYLIEAEIKLVKSGKYKTINKG